MTTYTFPRRYSAEPSLLLVSVRDTVLREFFASRMDLVEIDKATETGVRTGGAWFYRSTGRAYKAGNWDRLTAVVPSDVRCPKCGEPTVRCGDMAATSICVPCQYRLRLWEKTGGAT